MIRNEREYKEAFKRLREEKIRFGQHRQKLKDEGFDEGQIKSLMNPLESFHLQLAEEVEHYERLRRGDFRKLENLEGMGRLLVSLRIAKGISQRQLAERLEVSETSVSRDERNEYHGVTLDRAIKILNALDVRIVTRVAELGEQGNSTQQDEPQDEITC